MKRIANVASRIALALVLAAALTPVGASAQDEAKAADDGPRVIEVTILGMSCPFCAYGAEQKLKKLDGVADLDIVLKTGLATLTLDDDADVPNEKLIDAVEDAGFEVARITRNFESRYGDYDAKDGA